MLRWLWKDGRFAWGAIAAAVFLTVSILAFDVAWRVVRLRFDALLICGVLIDAAAAAVLVLVARQLIRARRQA